MQVRIGVCTNCGAKFEIPTDFDQPWAKCLICESAVKVGEPEKSDAAKKAERAAAAEAKAPSPPKPKAPKPKAPAAKPAAAAAAATAAGPAEAELEAEPLEVEPLEPEPAPAPPKAAPAPAPAVEAELEEADLELEPLEELPAAKPMSTLERLKAERAAQQPAEEATSDKPLSTLERIKAERASGRESAPESKRQPAKSAGSAPRSRTRDTGDDGDGGSRGGAGRSRGKRRRPAAAKAERSQAPMLIGGGSLVIVGIGVLGITQGWFGGGNDAAAEEPAETAASDVAAADATPTETAPNPFDQIAATGAADLAGAGGAAGTATGAAGAGAAAAAAPAPAPKKPAKDPDSVDLTALPTFEKLPETSDDDWNALVADALKLADPVGGIGAQRAQGRLIEAGKAAMPAIMNAFKTVDLYTDEGRRTGALVQRTLEDITNGTNFSWRDGLEPGDIYFNKRVVEEWNKLWQKAKDNEFTWRYTIGEVDKEGNEIVDEPSGDDFDG